jgi:hypothetical protein
MRIVVLTALWKRPHIAKVMLGNLSRCRLLLKDEVELVPLAVGSELETSRSLAAAYDVEYTECVNILGEGIEFMGILDGYMYQLSTRKLVHWRGYRSDLRRGEPIGSGRCFSASLLRKMGWKPWDPSLRCGLDYDCTKKIKSLRVSSRAIWMEAFEIKHLGVKTEENICKFETLLTNPENDLVFIDPTVMPGWFGTDIAGQLERISRPTP